MQQSPEKYDNFVNNRKFMESWFIICQNYQKGRCYLNNCRYFHLSSDIIEIFLKDDQISQELLMQATDKILKFGLTFERDSPLCIDYLQNVCYNATCEFEHLSNDKFEAELKKVLYMELKAHFSRFPCKRRFSDEIEDYEQKSRKYLKIDEENGSDLDENISPEEFTNERNHFDDIEIIKLKKENSELIQENVQLYDKVLILEDDLRKKNCHEDKFKSCISEYTNKLFKHVVNIENSVKDEAVSHIHDNIDLMKDLRQCIIECITTYGSDSKIVSTVSKRISNELIEKSGQIMIRPGILECPFINPDRIIVQNEEHSSEDEKEEEEIVDSFLLAPWQPV